MATKLVPAGGTHEIYIAPDEGAKIDVKIESETVWLTAAQMAELFGRDISVIRKHVRNTFREGEVADDDSYRHFLPVTSSEGGRPEPTYSLDVIISVGYRVKSQRGVEFRRWATRILKDYLVRDYRKRADEAQQVISGLKHIELLARDVAGDEEIDAAETLNLIERYAKSWRVLLQYDENILPPPSSEPSKRMARLTLRQATKLVDQFKKTLLEKGQATDLFGTDRGDGLASIVGNLSQTWGGHPVYPNVESRAAHLLYFVIKNHPFLDGNKRIGSFLFVHYLNKNNRPLIDEFGLVALALLIAESDPKHKDIVVRLTISLMKEAHGHSSHATHDA